MLKRDYEGQVCSIAGSLELIGDRWTLLIVRDLIFGLSRFDQLHDSLGISGHLLTDRLNRLVDEGVVERVRYSERPDRFEYQLTRKGRELGPVLLALMQWGDRHLSEKPPRIARRRSDRSRVSVALVAADGLPVAPGDLELVPGPGAQPAGSERRAAARGAR